MQKQLIIRNLGPAASALIASVVMVQAAGANGLGDVSKLPAASPKNGVTFTKDIKPLFDRSCTECHGEEKQKAKLRLDSLEHTLKGSRGEPVLIKGKSVESRIVFSVARAMEDEDYWMPPEGKAEPFTKDEIALLRAWIDQGAK